MTKKIEFTLLENGLDFIARAVGELRRDPTPRNLKYGVLHLKAGADLVLKERLRIHDWQLLFDDLTLAERHAFDAGAFRSPGTEEVLKRLRDQAGVRVRARDKRNLYRLRVLRNRIEHFAITDSATVAMAITRSVSRS